MEKLKKYKLYIICIIIIILSIVSIIFQKSQKNLINNKEIKSDSNGYIAVYITGAVVKEGVYNIKQEARVQDLIEAAGGIKPEADLEKINLAKKIIDGEKVDIPYKEKIVETIEDEDIEETEEESTDFDKVNINKASKEELMTLEGIGEVSAKNIIEYRNKNKFDYIEDIMNVKGIGTAKFEKIKEFLQV